MIELSTLTSIDDHSPSGSSVNVTDAVPIVRPVPEIPKKSKEFVFELTITPSVLETNLTSSG